MISITLIHCMRSDPFETIHVHSILPLPYYLSSQEHLRINFYYQPFFVTAIFTHSLRSLYCLQQFLITDHSFTNMKFSIISQFFLFLTLSLPSSNFSTYKNQTPPCSTKSPNTFYRLPPTMSQVNLYSFILALFTGDNKICSNQFNSTPSIRVP